MTIRLWPQAARNRLWSEDDAMYDRLQPKDGKDTQGVVKPSQADRRPTGADRNAGADPSTIPVPTTSFVTPPPTQPDPLLQEPIPVLNTDKMADMGTRISRMVD